MLGFTLNEEQDAFRAAVRGFAEKSLAPRVEELERTETFPMDLFRELGRLGYLGVGYPEEFGGSGGDMLMRCLLIEEIGRVNCGFAAALLAHVGLGCIPLLRFGTDAQKRQYLVPALRGDKLGCWGLSEPSSGSDAASIRTTAVRQGDEYVINGSKMFITNGNIADYCLIAAYTDRSQRGAGISTFVVDTTTPGFHVSKKLRKTGHHTSETAALTFEDLRVPASALLGGIEGGFKQVTGTLEGGRITHAARSVGVSQAALEAALGYAREREQFGQKIAKFQGIRWMIADMATEIEAARLLMLSAAQMKDAGENYSLQASMAKLYASEMVNRITAHAVQLHGGYGFTKEYAVERYYRDARVFTIYEGTSEIQRIVISNHVLKDKRNP